MAIAASYPSIKPSLSLDFANVGALDPRITFTRSTTATYYDGVTTAKAEENLFTYSQEFDNAAWLKTNTTIAANSTTAPDGTTTADTFTQIASPTNDLVQQTVTVTSGATVTFSVFAKKNVGDWLRVAVGSGSNYFICSFDLTNGVKGTDVSLGTGVLVSSSISASTNGFYRVSITGYIPSTTSYPCLMFVADADNSGTRLSNGSAYIWGAQLEQRSSVTAYTPTTTQPITNYIPVLQTAAAGQARFDHNPTTGEALGLLIEEQRTNLLTYSEDFSNAAWSNLNNSTITSNAAVAPDGTLTADKLVGTGSNPFVGRDTSGVSGSAYSASCYAKAGELNWVRLTNFQFSTNAAWFNLQSGVVGTVVGAGNTAYITPVGNGWYRCVLNIASFDTANSATEFVIATTNADNTTAGYTGDGYSGIFIWGAQLE